MGRLAALFAAILITIAAAPASVYAEDELPEGDAEDTLPEGDAPARPPPTKKGPPAPKPEPKPAPEPAPEPDAEIEEETDELEEDPGAPPPAPEPPPPPPPPAPKGKVLVLIASDREDQQGALFEIARETTRRLASARDLEPIDLAASIDPDAAAARGEAIAGAIESIAAGLASLEELDLEAATSRLDPAIATLIAELAELDADQRRALESGLFGLAAASLFDGQAAAAESVFVALSLLSPSYEPDASRYPSNVITRFREVRSGLSDRPGGGLTVITTPAGASVFVDGALRGLSPLTIEPLEAGQHAVAVERLGYRRSGTLAPVDVARVSSLELDLEPGPGLDRLDAIRPALARDARAARDAGASFGATHILVLAVARTSGKPQVEGLWLDVRSGLVLGKIQPTALPADPDVAADTLRNAVEAAESERLHEPSPSEGGLLSKWWFWALVGGAAAAAASVTAIAASGASRPPSSGHLFGF